jgi:2-polyprenyl-6-methoxyphenol hydroxylase-like FAD-dependent oxidoreductase
MKKFAIVGGGIGGLTLAIAMQQKGLDVVVFESAPNIKPLGAGIVLAGNAIKAFAEIGIHEQVLKTGKQIKLLRIKNKRGNTLSELNAEKISTKYGINNFAIHRADLHQILLKGLKEGTLILNKSCVDIEQDNKSVTVKFSDNTTAIFDYVIGCDGIHSAIRKKIFPNTETRFAGYTCFRAVINELPKNFNVTESTETWGARGRFGIVPLNTDHIYWFACINTTFNNPVMRTMTPDDLLKYFSDFHYPVSEVLKLTKPEQVIWSDIIDLKPLNKFTSGRIALLGDAAHATTPNMGQGACMAIEDAVILTNCLVKEKTIEDAFSQYELKRIPRTKYIVNNSWRIGKIAQLENPFLIRLRNAVIKMTPQSVTDNQIKFLYAISFG